MSHVLKSAIPRGSKRVAYAITTIPQFPCDFLQLSHNLSQLDWTLHDRNPPPLDPCSGAMGERTRGDA